MYEFGEPIGPMVFLKLELEFGFPQIYNIMTSGDLENEVVTFKS